MGLGGAQRVLEGLISHSKNEEWFFYSLKKCPKTHKSLFCRNSNWKYDFISLFEVKRLIKEKNINILHCHLKKSFFIGYLIKRFFFPNIILIFHEHGKIEGKKYIKFLNFAKKRVDFFIAVSDATQKRLIQYVKIPERQVKTIVNYVDLDRFNPENINKFDKFFEREQFGVADADFVVGFAARIVAEKGWKALLFAAHLLKDRNIKFLIAGTGPDIIELLNLIQDLNLKDNVKYIGFIDDIRRFYCSIDCFILPSKWEGLPMAVLEAQACGIPVLASDVEGLNEVVRDMETGILFEKENFEEIAEKIEFLIEHEDFMRRIIKNSLENVQNHSLNDYFKKLKRMYSEFGDDIQ